MYTQAWRAVYCRLNKTCGLCAHTHIHAERAGKPSMSLRSAKARVVCAVRAMKALDLICPSRSAHAKRCALSC